MIAIVPSLCARIIRTSLLVVTLAQAGCGAGASRAAWVIDTQEEWRAQTEARTNLVFRDGFAVPSSREATFRSRLRTFDTRRSVRSIVLEQSPIWQNWNPVDNVGPSNLRDAPVLLCLGPKDYWMFGRHGGDHGPKAGGYHAWHSRDMVDWVHHGPVTEGFSRWVTTAEYVDGKFYVYYDYPNDQDPHVYVDEDVSDGVPGKDRGLAFADPSHGSDCTVIRDESGRFHVIYEDWSPIDPSRRSWDSPLAGHAVSEDGLGGFEILAPAVDRRTRPTGETGRYTHPHWKQHPDWDTNVGEYSIHEPEQEAYGDWAAIRVGTRYYLFCDVDPVGGHAMSVGWFTSGSLNEPFEWCDRIGKGHPDPDIGFAEGRFYLITQQKTDYVSPGPWVESVEARVGVDTNRDGAIDRWTDWQAVKESYHHTPGFAKHVGKTAAAMNLTDLPAGFGFRFELRVTDLTENESRPILDKVRVQFEE